jgi:hypothetical protein
MSDSAAIEDNDTPGGTAGGVNIRNGGTLTMRGNAVIRRNHVTGASIPRGGGVFIEDSGDNDRSRLIMEGGAIYENSTPGTGGTGGGVFASRGGTLELRAPAGQNSIHSNAPVNVSVGAVGPSAPGTIIGGPAAGW